MENKLKNIGGNMKIKKSTARYFKKLCNNFKRVFIVIFAIIVCMFPYATATAQTTDQLQQQATLNPLFDIIHESSDSYTITSGVTCENIQRFTQDGWLSINVIRIDNDDPYIKLDSLVNPESLQILTAVPALAQSRNAVAAVNGSFFNWSKVPGLNSPIGPMVESGVIKTTSSDFNRYSNSMATFAQDKTRNLLYEFWKSDIKLIKQDGSSLQIARYNMQLNDKGEITLIDRNWSQKSIGTAKNKDNNNKDPASTAQIDIVEMIVENNVVAEIRQNLPAVEIPQNGFVVVASNNNTKQILDNFKKGDIVTAEITTVPDWKNISMAITGGAIILKDGAVPSTFSHNSPGRNPRTAIGSTADGKQIIMVTVDGRQQSSLGMTLPELGLLMQELGAYNALNLDGGGSTTMAARKPGTNDIEVVNSPSDGMPRKVGNAVGVISIAPSTPLAGLIIDTEDRNVFVNTTRTYTIRGYDSYFNPVEIDPSSVKWAVSGIEGSFEGSTFRPSSVGSGKIIASINDISAEYEVNSLSSPVQLILSENSISLQIGNKKNLSVIGKNKNGYYAKINPEDVLWKLSANIGTLEKGSITATSEGKGYIEVSLGETKSYCKIMTAVDVIQLIDDFEKLNGSYLSYPENIPGKYELSSEQKHSGNYSGKLTYDFTDSKGSRASYLLFSNGGYKLSENVQKIGIWVYNANPNPNWLRALIYDANGGVHYIDFTQKMDWIGWKYVEANVSEVKPKPLTLARIYLVQVQDVPDAGSIYFDDMTFISIPNIQDNDLVIPNDTIPIDEDNKSVVYKECDNCLKFSVFSQSNKITTPLERLLLLRLTTNINGYKDAAIFLGENSSNSTAKIGKPFLAVYNGFRSLDIKNSRFIQLDTNKKGLRLSNSNQWKWFLNELESFKGDNLFIFLNDPPQSFNDKLEASLFQNILTEYKQTTLKNVWVFYKGNSNTSYMERGIKYLSCAGMDIEGLNPSNAGLVKYIDVTVMDEEVTFQFISVIQ